MNTEGNSKDIPAPTEREKWEKDISLKERELCCKESELDLKKREQTATNWKNPLIVAIMAATVAALGNAAVTMTNGILQRQLEDQKSEQLRILEMIKTGDPDKAAENLKFLLNAGLISKPEIVSKLGEFLSKRRPGSGPTLPSGSLLGENSLTERIKALKKKEPGKVSSIDEGYTVENHVLLNQRGEPVSIVETPSKGSSIKSHKAIVMHFTGMGRSDLVLKWLATSQAKSSAHVVIDRLGKVTQLVPFDIAAFHAGASSWKGLTGMNNYSLAIELVNAGKLSRMVDGRWKSGRGEVYEEKDVLVEKDKVSGELIGWHKYTEEQLVSAQQVISALAIAYPTIDTVIGHSDISPQKIDPGPALPFERLRAALSKARVEARGRP